MRHDEIRAIKYYHIDEPEYVDECMARWDTHCNHLIIHQGDAEIWYSLMDDMDRTGALPTGEDWFLWRDGMVTVIPVPHGGIV